MSKAKRPKLWSGTVNLDRLDAATGRWRITTGAAKEPLPREVAADPAVRASVVAWMTAHRGGTPPTPDASKSMCDAIRESVTAAFRAMAAGGPGA